MKTFLQNRWALAVSAGLAAATLPAGTALAVDTSISTDNTLSGITPLDVHAPGSGVAYIKEVNGKLAGSNLFYSFSKFDVGTGDTAWFNLNTGGLSNVISRVTGGAGSMIDGTLKMTNAAGGAPGFFFINPQGITFGANAQVNVPGSFYASTASKLNFADGYQYNADGSNTSSLSAAKPESFGFLGDESGALNIGNAVSGPTLTFQPGTDAVFAGNAITIDNATLNNADSAQAGIELRLVSTGGEAVNVDFDKPPTQATAGNLFIERTGIDVSGSGSGRLAIQAGDFIVSDSDLFADNYGDTPMSSDQGMDIRADFLSAFNSYFTHDIVGGGGGGSMQFAIKHTLTLDSGSIIRANSYGDGSAGSLSIEAGQLTLVNTGMIASRAFGRGAGNGLTISADSLNIFSGAIINTDVFNQGNAAAIDITAKELLIDGQNSQFLTGITSFANPGSSGNAGQISVNADIISLQKGGWIYSSTFSIGNAGAVVLNAGQAEIDGQGYPTGIGSVAETGSQGNSAEVQIFANSLMLANGASVSASTRSQGSAGGVTVKTDNLLIDGNGTNYFTGIVSNAEDGSGDAGQVDIFADNSLELKNNGQILSTTYTQGKAGLIAVTAKELQMSGNETLISSATVGTGNAEGVKVTANQLKMFDGAEINSNSYGHGDAGIVEIDAKQLEMADKAEIGSSSFDQGNGGKVIIDADQVAINGNGLITGVASGAAGTGDAGDITLTARGSLTLTDGGFITSNAEGGTGNAGTVSIDADLIELSSQKNHSFIGSNSTGTGNAGLVKVTSNDLTLSGYDGYASYISSNTSNSGKGGQLTIKADNLTLNGQGGFAYISADTLGGTGNAGDVSIDSKDLKLFSQGPGIGQSFISSSTAGAGNAGDLNIFSNRIEMYGSRSVIISNAVPGSTGNAGSIFINAPLSLEMFDGGQISSSTFAQGKAGKVTVNAGQIVLDGVEDNLTGITSSQAPGSSGEGGEVEVTADSIKLLDGASISSLTYGQRKAGEVSVNAQSIEADGQGNVKQQTGISSDALPGSVGGAGSVTVTTDSLRLVDGGAVSSGTAGLGSAGFVDVDSRQIYINGKGYIAGILSDSLGYGNAGEIRVRADSLQIFDNGQIGTSAGGPGSAGTIDINAGNILIQGRGNIPVSLLGKNIADDHTGIFSKAYASSNGQTGFISVNASNGVRLEEGAQISISNEATVANADLLKPTSINIKSPNLFLTGSQIVTAASGNVDAGNINISFKDSLYLDPSAISTSANEGAGGDINIHGGNLFYLQNSQITTSVSGQTAGERYSGGDINVSSNYLIMDSGFIQANTAAEGASGGTVNVDVPTLIPSGSSIFVGGNTPFEFQPYSGLNVIQAAAPDGVGGAVNVTTPQLNLSGTLATLIVQSFDPNAISRNLCAIGEGSSLAQSGKGALRRRAKDALLSTTF